MTYEVFRIENGEFVHEIDGEEIERRPAEEWELPAVIPNGEDPSPG